MSQLIRIYIVFKKDNSGLSRTKINHKHFKFKLLYNVMLMSYEANIVCLFLLMSAFCFVMVLHNVSSAGRLRTLSCNPVPKFCLGSRKKNLCVLKDTRIYFFIPPLPTLIQKQLLMCKVYTDVGGIK